MKNLLVLTLVLGMVGLANAGLSLTKNVDGVSATLSTTDTLAYNAYLIVEQTGNAYTIEFTPNGDPAGTSTVGGIEDYADGFDWRFLTIVSTDVLKPLVAGDQVIITIADPQIPTIVQLYDGTGFVALSEQITLGVPEPASLALLGLGGLFLRRRK